MELNQLVILIKGGGEVASAVAHRLWFSGFRYICMTEVPEPMAVHRGTTFSEVVFEGEKTVEGLTAKLIDSNEQVHDVWADGKVPLIIDPEAAIIDYIHPHVIVDAIMAKKNLGTKMSDASLVVGIGPGFEAGEDVDLVIESYHNEKLGKVISSGKAEPDNQVPFNIGGYTYERAIHAPATGEFKAIKNLCDIVVAGEEVASVGGQVVKAEIGGIIRALMRDGLTVNKGIKIVEIDPTGDLEVCFIIRAKMRAIAGGVLEAVMMSFNS
jgi:xanthine dehydrogenase accessory factor